MAVWRARILSSAEGRWGLPPQEGRVRGRRCPPRPRRGWLVISRIPDPGGAGAPPPAAPLHSQTAPAGEGVGAGNQVPVALPACQEWRFSPKPLFSIFGYSAKGWNNRMGTGLVAVWRGAGTFLKKVGAGSDCSDVQFLWDTSSALSSQPLA